MGHKHTRAEILDGALATALDGGLSQLTFGRVAKHLGISDRIVVYYFPSKDELITEVLGTLAVRLQDSLALALGAPVADHRELAQATWGALARVEVDPVFALFLEAMGLAAAGREPFQTIVPTLVELWIDWAADFVTGPAARRRSEAEAAIAVLDGLLLLRQLRGPQVADRAARVVGIRSTRRS